MKVNKRWAILAMAVVLLLASVLVVCGQGQRVEWKNGVEIRYGWTSADLWRKPVTIFNRSGETRYIAVHMMELHEATVCVSTHLNEVLGVEYLVRGTEPYAPVSVFVMPPGSRVKTTRDHTERSAGVLYLVNGEVR